MKAGGDFAAELATGGGVKAGGAFTAGLGADIPVDPPAVPKGEERAGGGAGLPFRSGIVLVGGAGGGDGIVAVPDGADIPPILAKGLLLLAPAFCCGGAEGRTAGAGGAFVVLLLSAEDDGFAMADK